MDGAGRATQDAKAEVGMGVEFQPFLRFHPLGNCSVIAPALLYHLHPCRRPGVALGLCSRLDSTDSFHGIVPATSMWPTSIPGSGFLLRSTGCIHAAVPLKGEEVEF